MQQSFTDHAHTSSIRCVASNSKFIATGGVDERIRIFNMVKRADVGTLFQHENTITHCEFYQDSNLFTSSDDGTICIWNAANWECEKTLRGHKDSVLFFSVHPSGKLLLSVSKDKTVRTWNLIKGRSAYVINLKTVAHFVSWSPDGSHFVILVDKRADIYQLAIGGIVHSINSTARINCVEFLNVKVYK